MQQHQHVTPEMFDCIRVCSDCHDICMQTIHYCLHMGGRHAEPHHIRLLADCTQICQTSKDFMLRGSDMHNLTCRACAEICRRCAEDCMRIDGKDTQMKACADQCSRCAESCQKMAM